MSKKIPEKFVPKSERTEGTKKDSKDESKQKETQKPTKQPAEHVPFVCPDDIDDQIAKAAESGDRRRLNNLCIMRRSARNAARAAEIEAEKRAEKTEEQK